MGKLKNGTDYFCSVDLVANRDHAVGIYRREPLDSEGVDVFDSEFIKDSRIYLNSKYTITFAHPSGKVYVSCHMSRPESFSGSVPFSLEDLNGIYAGSAVFSSNPDATLKGRLSKAMASLGTWFENSLTSRTVNDRAIKNFNDVNLAADRAERAAGAR